MYTKREHLLLLHYKTSVFINLFRALYEKARLCLNQIQADDDRVMFIELNVLGN